MWIGAHKERHGEWERDDDGTELAGVYLNWFPGEGNDNSGGGEFVRAQYDKWNGVDYNGQWSDEEAFANAATTAVVICARNLGKFGKTLQLQ